MCTTIFINKTWIFRSDLVVSIGLRALFITIRDELSVFSKSCKCIAINMLWNDENLFLHLNGGERQSNGKTHSNCILNRETHTFYYCTRIYGIPCERITLNFEITLAFEVQSLTIPLKTRLFFPELSSINPPPLHVISEQLPRLHKTIHIKSLRILEFNFGDVSSRNKNERIHLIHFISHICFNGLWFIWSGKNTKHRTSELLMMVK